MAKLINWIIYYLLLYLCAHKISESYVKISLNTEPTHCVHDHRFLPTCLIVSTFSYQMPVSNGVHLLVPGTLAYLIAKDLNKNVPPREKFVLLSLPFFHDSLSQSYHCQTCKQKTVLSSVPRLQEVVRLFLLFLYYLHFTLTHFIHYIIYIIYTCFFYIYKLNHNDLNYHKQSLIN